MKRYYVTKMNNAILFIIVFIVAAICGSLYALYIQKDSYDILFAINSCMAVKENDLRHFEIFKNAFMVYLKQLGIVWIANLNAFTIPIVIIVFFVTVFSYSFTVACFIMIYGMQGIWMCFKIFGIQSAAITLLIIYIGVNNPIFNSGLKKDSMTSHVINLITILSVISVVSLLDAYVFLFV